MTIRPLINLALFTLTISFCNCKKKKELNISIGDYYQGGVVVYILKENDIGYELETIHGLIVAQSDQDTVEWGCYGVEIPGADGIKIGTGYQNTKDIVSNCSTILIAAKICDDLVLNGYSDWYLPSKDELNQLYLYRKLIGGFPQSGEHWSSTESTKDFVWRRQLYYGGENTNRKDYKNKVRAIRSF